MALELTAARAVEALLFMVSAGHAARACNDIVHFSSPLAPYVLGICLRRNYPGRTMAPRVKAAATASAATRAPPPRKARSIQRGRLCALLSRDRMMFA